MNPDLTPLAPTRIGGPARKGNARGQNPRHPWIRSSIAWIRRIPKTPPPGRRLFVLFVLLLLVAPVIAEEYPGAPASVTAAYIEADGAGLALDGETAPKLLHYTTWKETPGWDSFVVIASYEIGAVGWDREKAKDGDPADVQILYHVLGKIDGMGFTSQPAKEDVTFQLIKRRGRWKIEAPQLPPHLMLPAAISALEAVGAKDDPTGKATLKKLHTLE